MAGTAKRIWQPCICQPNDPKIKKKTGVPKGGPWPTQDPPKIATALADLRDLKIVAT